MEKHKIIISEQARQDLRDLSNVIIFEYKSPETAVRYLKGVHNSIQSLKHTASAFQFQTNPTIVNAYGPFVRRINYKKMAILFIIQHRIVYVIRVIPQGAVNDIQLLK